MKLKRTKLITFIGLSFGSFLFGSNSAQAAKFTTNVSLTPDGEIIDKSIFSDDEEHSVERIKKVKDDEGNVVQDDEGNVVTEVKTFYSDIDTTRDIYLKSITQNDIKISDFSFVKRVSIGSNDEYNGGNTGAASTDKGDNVAGPDTSERLTAGYQDDEKTVAKFVGNRNLNKIIDTEKNGSFAIDFFFDSDIRANNQGVDSFFIWERGIKKDKDTDEYIGNSDLAVQAIDAAGNILGDVLKLSREEQHYTGFAIKTLEIKKAQKVGSWGVSFEDLVSNNRITSISGIRVISESDFNGPDYKLVAYTPTSKDFIKASVPEPGTIIGLGSVAALAFVRRRKSK